MARFTDKVILITGGASGIGLATSKAFAAEGAKVVIADLNADKVEEAVAAIRGSGGQVTGIATDVTDFSACERMVAHAVTTFGGLHIAFNNAGIPSGIGGEFEDFSVEDWNRVMTTNVGGIFFSMKAEAPALKASGGTAIVNTASVASFVAAAGMAAYVTSKHAVAGLTKSASLDFIPHGIRVNAVCPGFVETPMLAGAIATPESKSMIEGQAPIGRVAQPEEIAKAVLFLASEDAGYMVGALMQVDGGVTIP